MAARKNESDITIIVSYALGFEHRATSTPNRIVDAASRKVVEDFIEFDRKLAGLRADAVATVFRFFALA